MIAVDLHNHRLKLARELGATHSINNRAGDLGPRIAAITGGGVDYAVESSADSAMGRLAVELLNPGGQAAWLSGAGASRAGPGDGRCIS